MRTLLQNLTIVPMTDEGLVLTGDIGIDGKNIAFVGKDETFKADIIKDCSGMVALPSFINAHCHLAMTLMKNYKDQCANLQDWLSEIFPIEDKLTPDDVYIASKLGLIELIKSGCTCFADMYYFRLETIKACIETGVRGAITFMWGSSSKDTIDEMYQKHIECTKGSTLIEIHAAEHAIYTVSPDDYKAVAKWARENNVILNTHLSETQKEVDDCIKEHGMRPAHYLDSLGFFDSPCYVAHGVFLDDSEVELLAKKGVSVVHNPSSNCKLASGIAPVAHYKNKGLNIALGTDGASSNNNLNMLEEINLASLISIVSTKDTLSLTPYRVLEMATINGAKALGLDKKIGTIEVGKEADITLINTNKANMRPLNDVLSAIVYSASEENIDTVFCQGRMLMEGRNLLTISEEDVINDVEQAWAAVKNR